MELPWHTGLNLLVRPLRTAVQASIIALLASRTSLLAEHDACNAMQAFSTQHPNPQDERSDQPNIWKGPSNWRPWKKSCRVRETQSSAGEKEHPRVNLQGLMQQPVCALPLMAAESQCLLTKKGVRPGAIPAAEHGARHKCHEHSLLPD